jgi:hypothetical protein
MYTIAFWDDYLCVIYIAVDKCPFINPAKSSSNSLALQFCQAVHLGLDPALLLITSDNGMMERIEFILWKLSSTFFINIVNIFIQTELQIEL